MRQLREEATLVSLPSADGSEFRLRDQQVRGERIHYNTLLGTGWPKEPTPMHAGCTILHGKTCEF